ncbi:HAMP domain-containing sensor histidine kinase [Kribbella sp. NPDC005582]|uniref:sensor histidine kinase n=1 Tax=Kribbella sp. NPDC005582 TaxID=3156893 RepID=UPI0033AF397D
MSAISFRAPDHGVAVRTGRQRLDRFRRGLRDNRRTDVLLAIFAVAMLLAMNVMVEREVVPYHLLFLGLTLVYGFRVWPLAPTLIVTALITLVTGWILVAHQLTDGSNRAEWAEIPLMPLLFLAMVWHARRRVAAQREVERMAEQRRDVLAREREFFRDASHAIRTPVTIARGHLELLESAVTDSTARDDLAIALRQLDRMSALSNRLLALARLDAGHAVRRQWLDVGSFLAEIVRNWTTSADRDWQVDPLTTRPAPFDPEWLELAIDAVIENAVHFTGPGDRIQLSCRVEPDRFVISIGDSGPGIDTEDLPHVFERFWHRRPPSGSMGSGLGLPMAQAVAQAHGGQITARTGPLGGALFEITAPATGPEDHTITD